MKTLVVTGGIGSGKSVVCGLLAGKGIPVYDSDARTKSLYDSDSGLLKRLSESFGEDIVGADGRLDRKCLASVVFSDMKRLEELEAIVHPAVLEDFRIWKSGQESKSCFVVFESAIILQKPLFKSLADKILLVDAPLDVRLGRACARDAASRESVLDRMERQKLLNDISEGKVKPDVDFVITNDGSLEELKSKVDELYLMILSVKE